MVRRLWLIGLILELLQFLLYSCSCYGCDIEILWHDFLKHCIDDEDWVLALQHLAEESD